MHYETQHGDEAGDEADTAPALVDYTDSYSRTYGYNPLLVQGKGTNVLVLERLSKPVNGAHFALTYKWLSSPCQAPSDQAYACVKGQETTLWKIDEICQGRSLMHNIGAGKADLFKHFNLF